MNSLQPLKQEYRHIAELQLLAQKDYKAYREQQGNTGGIKIAKVPDYAVQSFTSVKEAKDNDDFKWDKLLAEIDNIQVA